MLYTVIKVSKKSEIRLKNCKAYRAINNKELQYYVDKFNNELNVIIYENPSETEVAEAEELSTTIDKTVLIYYSEEANKTSDSKLFSVVGLNKLQDYLFDKFNEDVLTHIRDDISSVEIIDNSDLFDTLSSEESNKPDTTESNSEKEIQEALSAISKNTESISTDNDEEKIGETYIATTKSDLQISEIVQQVIHEEHERVEREAQEENTVSNEEVEKLKNQLKDKQAEVETVRNSLNNATARISELNSITKAVKEQYNDLNKRLESIVINDNVTEVIIGSSSESEYKEKIKQLEHDIDDLNIKLMGAEQLEDTVGQLRESIKEKESEIADLQEKLSNSVNSEEINNIKQELFIVKTQFRESEDRAEDLSKELTDTKEKLTEKTDEYSDLIQSMRATQEKYDNVQSEIDTLHTQIQEKDESIKQVAEDYEKRIRALNEEKVQKANETAQIVNRFSLLQEKFRELNDKYITTKEKLDEVNSYDIATLSNKNAVLEKENDAMIGEVGKYERRLAESDKKLGEQKQIIEDLSQQIEHLKITNDSVIRTSRLNDNITFRCDYSGRANIISVCGSGSVGVTTTAISICNKIRGNVLLIDFDTVSPKANMILGNMRGEVVNPIIKELNGFDKQTELFKTSLGCLINKGVDYFIENESLTIRNIIKTRDGYKLDYLSGIYTKPSISMLMSTDFSQFLSYLGNTYDYIVCDCGRVGGGEIQSAIQRMFDEISFKKVLVALHEDNDMRNLALRIGAEKLSRKQSVWMLNMSRSKDMTTLMGKCLAKAPYTLMPINMNMYGMGVTFDTVRTMNTQMDDLTSKILGGAQ